MVVPSPWGIRSVCPVHVLPGRRCRSCCAAQAGMDWPRCAWGWGRAQRWHSSECEGHARDIGHPFKGGRTLLHYPNEAELSSAQWNKGEELKGGMDKLSFEVNDGVAVLKFDNPPVNSLGLELRQALTAAIERANADAGVEAIVLIGSGAGFSGGAGIREFGPPRAGASPNLRPVISKVEDSAKPVIAAIGGVCMGGGLELAMGCHYRVGVPAARIALPEVKLGLLPGAGGTQRLPRLLGVEAALNIIVSGAPVASEK